MEDHDGNVDDVEWPSSSDVADEGLAFADVAVLKNRLNLSEEICSDVKEDLSKTRNECLRLQGAEVCLCFCYYYANYHHHQHHYCHYQGCLLIPYLRCLTLQIICNRWGYI